MPIINGYEALKKVKEMNLKIPVIAQSAYTSDDDKEKINLAGFDDFIAKPIEQDKLLQIVKQWILD